MSLIPCSGCDKRPEEKPAQVTWAWLDENRVRQAYRQRLCVRCFCVRVLAYDKAGEPQEGLTCPACGIDTLYDMSPVYVTAFVPGAGKFRYEWPMCEPHALDMRMAAMQHAEHLENRDPVSSGQATGTQRSLTAAWDALGLQRDDDQEHDA